MADNKTVKNGTHNASRDLAVLTVVAVLVFVLSYFFNVFAFLVRHFQENPSSIIWIDEIVSVLLTLSIGFSVFSWRRWMEIRKETAKRIKLQEELLKIAETKAEVERIICKQLHCDIEEYRKIEKDILSRKGKTKGQAE